MDQKKINILIIFLLVINIFFCVFIFYKFNEVTLGFKTASEDMQIKSEQFTALINKPFELPGKGLEYYDMSKPESSLESIKEMMRNVDLKAGYDLYKHSIQDDKDTYLKYLSSDTATISIVKTHVIKKSYDEDNIGKVITLVKVADDGVNYRDVYALEKNNGIFLKSFHYISEYSKDKWTKEDRFVYDMVNTWKTTGKIK